MAKVRRATKRRQTIAASRPTVPRSAEARLDAAEALFRDFCELTPFRYRPFVRSFESWDDYEKWRRAQTNPWYR
jgi:hypothetical protein